MPCERDRVAAASFFCCTWPLQTIDALKCTRRPVHVERVVTENVSDLKPVNNWLPSKKKGQQTSPSALD